MTRTEEHAEASPLSPWNIDRQAQDSEDEAPVLAAQPNMTADKRIEQILEEELKKPLAKRKNRSAWDMFQDGAFDERKNKVVMGLNYELLTNDLMQPETMTPHWESRVRHTIQDYLNRVKYAGTIHCPHTKSWKPPGSDEAISFNDPLPGRVSGRKRWSNIGDGTNIRDAREEKSPDNQPFEEASSMEEANRVSTAILSAELTPMELLVVKHKFGFPMTPLEQNQYGRLTNNQSDAARSRAMGKIKKILSS